MSKAEVVMLYNCPTTEDLQRAKGTKEVLTFHAMPMATDPKDPGRLQDVLHKCVSLKLHILEVKPTSKRRTYLVRAEVAEDTPRGQLRPGFEKNLGMLGHTKGTTLEFEYEADDRLPTLRADLVCQYTGKII